MTRLMDWALKLPDWVVYPIIGLGYLVGIVAGVWLLWLGVAAFLVYGYQAINWVLF